MKLYEASQDEKENGWTLSFSFLIEIQNEIEWSLDLEDETPSLEQIETTLLCFKKVCEKYRSDNLSFVEWYEKTYKEKWNQDYAELYGYANKISDEYEDYCKKNNINPIWNG